jgi:hypothetical protein
MTPLIISFDTRDLLESCSSLEIAERWLGSAHAQALVSLIADAEAFGNASELIEFFGADAQVAENDSISLAIGSDYRVVFVAAGFRVVRDTDGRIDWTSVQRLKLVDILRCP